MGRWIVGAITFLITLHCNEKNHSNPVSALPLDRNPIQMNVGDSWLYRHTITRIGLKRPSILPNPTIQYAFFQATKDTAIDLLPFLIIDGREYENGKDSIHPASP